VRRSVVRWGLVASILVAVMVARVFIEAKQEFQEGSAAYQAGKLEKAIVHFDRAAHWYAPGNFYVEKALNRLWEIGNQVEKEDPKMGLLAYDSLRGSIYAIRSFYWPYRDYLPRVNERIADLRAQEQVKDQSGTIYGAAHAFHRKALETDERPYIGWVAAVEIGFFGWIFAVVALIWKGFDREGRMHWKRSVPWMVAIVVFFTCWVFGLLNA